MRWSVFLVIQCLIILVIIGGFYSHQEHVIVLKEPPQSIAQWYKPQNKRQQWLHTMFRLRREMLAIEIYAETGDDNNLQKWTEKLSEDYYTIAEMVPEWQTRLDLSTIADIQKSVKEKRYKDVTHALVDLEESCKSCHTDFRAVTATMYRAPDFSDIKIDGSTSLISHMRAMSKQVNQIKIASVDGRQDAALSVLLDLEKGMNSLGDVCSNCHKQASLTYPNELMTRTMATLEQSLKTGSLADQGKALGTLAVMACAECHGTHRLAHDTKKLLGKEKNWSELLKHSF
jgi:cytochrome c556